MFPRAADHMLHQERVVLTGEPAESVFGKDQQSFRRMEFRSRLQSPAERLVVDSDHCAEGLILIRLHFDGVTSAVQQQHSEDLSGAFGSGTGGQNDSGIVLMAGRSASASEALHSGVDRDAHGMTLPRPFSLKIDHVIFGGFEIELRAHEFFDPDRLRTQVGDGHGAGDHIGMFKDAVSQDDPDIGKGIHHDHFQSFALLFRSERCG